MIDAFEYNDYDPPSLMEWQCPKHPNVKAMHIDQYIRDIPLPCK